MGQIGNPIVNSFIQAAQAQQVAARARDRDRASESAAKERLDKLDLRVEQTEAPEAVDAARNDDQHHPDQRRQPAAGTPGTPGTPAALGTPGASPDGGDGDAAGGEPDRPRLDLQA